MDELKEISGGPRVNLFESEGPGYWIGCGKSEFNPMEGPWEDFVRLAVKILSHPSTKEKCPEYYVERWPEPQERKEE